MVKQITSQKSLLLIGKAAEIKKSLHALLISHSEGTTLLQLVTGRV